MFTSALDPDWIRFQHHASRVRNLTYNFHTVVHSLVWVILSTLR